MDSYNNYITANFIAFYMEYLINLFILFLYILHLFQPFDVNVFVLLKHILIEEFDVISQFNFNCILRVD